MATLRVWFSGLCQFIDSKVPDDNKVCVCLVKALNHAAAVHELDWEKRYRPLGKKIHDLKEAYVSFRITYGTASKSAAPLESDFDEFGLVQLEDMAGDFAEGDADITNYEPSEATREKVIAQVFLPSDRRGSLRSKALVENWELPDTINQEFRRSMEVADPVFIEVHNVTAVDLVITPFDNNKPPCSVTLCEAGGLFEVIVVNNCTAKHRFLELRVGETEIKLVQVDGDFREHYSLLNPHALAAINGLGQIQRQGALPAPEKTIFLFSTLRGIPSAWKNSRQEFVVEGDDFVQALLAAMDSLVTKRIDSAGRGIGLLEAFSWAKYLVFRGLVQLILAVLEPRGAGVGSGCDCLPCGGKPQFFESP